MNTEQTPLNGLMVINPRVFNDHRGYFFESYNHLQFSQHVANVEFVQDNQSLSQQGVLRGLHFQKPPFAQGKLVRVIKGSVFDVAVDIRKQSPTFGQWFGLELSESNFKMLYIPPGFAHGFLTLENNTIFSYKCTNTYHPESEDALLWNDTDLNIIWPTVDTLYISEKDRQANQFNGFNTPF